MPTKQWFRLYNDVVDDPKVQRLPAELFRAWVNLLCLASRHDGILPDVPDLAFGLRCSEDEVVEVLERLMDAGLLEHTTAGLAPHNWDGRQFASDTSTGRVQEYRRRQRQTAHPNGNVSCNVSGNVAIAVTETPQSRTEQILTGYTGTRARAHPREGDAPCMQYIERQEARKAARRAQSQTTTSAPRHATM
jgi:hypothetical protein